MDNSEIVAIAEALEDWVRRGHAHKLLPSEAEPLRRIAALAEECAELAEKAEETKKPKKADDGGYAAWKAQYSGPHPYRSREKYGNSSAW